MTDIAAQGAPCVNGCTRTVNDVEVPLTARHGEFCNRCYFAAVRTLADAPALIEHMHVMVAPSLTVKPHEVLVAAGRAEAPMPLNEDAFNDTNEAYAVLARVAERVSKVTGSVPPATNTVWRTRLGNPRGTLGDTIDVTLAAQRMASWITGQLDALFLHRPDDVRPVLSYLAELRSLRSRWPVEERPRFSDMPHWQRLGCAGRIAIYQPDPTGHVPHIVCEKCSEILTDDQYDAAVHDYLRQQRELRQATQVRRHLIGKYAGTSCDGA